ncbi:MAG: hypothetical protein HZA49_06050 [Planctomycetes bacterium]|nr:hypothetical protein [Planctomycetota bacterium]
MRCKEYKCKSQVAGGKSLTALAARLMGYCRSHYAEHFPRRKPSNLPAARMGAERLLGWSERREGEQAGFNPDVWSPSFRREMEDYWDARMRGEVG